MKSPQLRCILDRVFPLTPPRSTFRNHKIAPRIRISHSSILIQQSKVSVSVNTFRKLTNCTERPVCHCVQSGTPRSKFSDFLRPLCSHTTSVECRPNKIRAVLKPNFKLADHCPRDEMFSLNEDHVGNTSNRLLSPVFMAIRVPSKRRSHHSGTYPTYAWSCSMANVTSGEQAGMNKKERIPAARPVNHIATS